MKKLSKLKLTQLSKTELEQRQMNKLRGGGSGDSTCNCGCAYNSVESNRDANAKHGYQYSAGDDVYTIKCECTSQFPLASMRGGDI